MKITNIPHLVYTHSDYDKVFSIWHNQARLYFPSSPIHLLSDKSLEESVTTTILYDSNLKYTDRVLSCLEQLDENMCVIFQHEDMPLYDFPMYDTLNEFIELVESDKVDMIRLLRVVPMLESSGIHPILYKNPSNNLFSIQPTIIKVKTLKEIFKLVPDRNIWEAEKYWELHLKGYVSLFPYINEKKRGMYHYDSKVYPYIATAITKGQWNIQEYPNELSKLFEAIP
jgi:hypothetical protein